MNNFVAEMVTAIYVSDLRVSQQFYFELLGLETIFDSDWGVQMSSSVSSSLNLTLQPRDHALVPETFRCKPQGFSIAFVVPDSDAVYQRAVSMGLQIVLKPTNEEYGRRRFLTVDPDGVLVDISSDCEPSKEFVAKYMSGA